MKRQLSALKTVITPKAGIPYRERKEKRAGLELTST